jgi:hypothetical protein
MAFSKISELTVTEFVGLTFAHFGHRAFTMSALSHYLCSILSDTFKVRDVRVVNSLNRMALEHGLIRPSQGKRGGIGFEVTEQGVEDAADIELPGDKFEHHSKLQEERSREASANAGPVFDALLCATAGKDVHGRAFVEKVFKHWRTHGWLSSAQVAAIARIGARYGEFVKERHYVGSALEGWITPYIQRQKDELAADQAAHDARLLALREKIAEKEQAKAATRDANRARRDALKQIELAGGLAELDALVTAVFPGVRLDAAAKTLAFSGAGSKELRACTAMVAFGKPPALVWQQSGNRTQPDGHSGVWQALIAHGACGVILERHERVGKPRKGPGETEQQAPRSE